MRPEGASGYDREPLTFQYDEDRDVLIVEGQEYSGGLFRQWSAEGMPTGTQFEIVRMGTGGFALKVIEDEPSAPMGGLMKRLLAAARIGG